MMQGLRRHLSFANVTSLMALTVALGGTSYAAITLPRNSVGSAQIKTSAVKNSDLGANSVTSAKVKNGALRAQDFAVGQLPVGPRGPAGANGATGPAGAPGAPGPTGTTGAATVQFFQAAADLANGADQSYSVFCPAGQQAIAGGGRGDDTLSEETILTNTRPAISAGNTEPPLSGQGFTGWRITVFNPIGGAASGVRPEVWVVCVAAPTA
jgi:hypothetical protein